MCIFTSIVISFRDFPIYSDCNVVKIDDLQQLTLQWVYHLADAEGGGGFTGVENSIEI